MVKVERNFQIFYGRMCSMLNGSGLRDELRNKTWAECAMITTYLSNIMATKSENKCLYVLDANQNSIIILKHLVKLEL